LLFIAELAPRVAAIELSVDLDPIAIHAAVPGLGLVAQDFECRDAATAQTLP